MRYRNDSTPGGDARRGRGHHHGEGRHHGESHPHGEGRHHAEGPRSKDGRRDGHSHGGVASILDGKPNAMLLFVGAVGCTRHRGFQMGELMREGRMALLCPTATDFASGRYLHQVVDAILELSQERNIKEFVIMYGCQWAVLSTDFDLLAQELREEHGISVTFHEHCHLCGSEHDDDDAPSGEQGKE